MLAVENTPRVAACAASIYVNGMCSFPSIKTTCIERRERADTKLQRAATVIRFEKDGSIEEAGTKVSFPESWVTTSDRWMT